jgi:hypothetical protein
MYLDTPGYVYKITHKETGQFYFGSRVANIKQNRLPSDDLWIHYFTSSKHIKKIILDNNPDIFIPEVVITHPIMDEVYWLEQDFIKEHISDPLCLNRHYKDRESGQKIFSTHGVDPWNKGLTKDTNERVSELAEESRGKSSPHKGKKWGEYSDERVKAASDARIGIEPWNKGLKTGPLSDGHKQSIIDSTKGIPKSEEHKQKQRKPKHPGHGAAVSKARRGVPLPKVVTRIHDRKLMDIRNFKKWLKNNPVEST